jgi:hypothetical protein
MIMLNGKAESNTAVGCIFRFRVPGSGVPGSGSSPSPLVRVASAFGRKIRAVCVGAGFRKSASVLFQKLRNYFPLYTVMPHISGSSGGAAFQSPNACDPSVSYRTM